MNLVSAWDDQQLGYAFADQNAFLQDQQHRGSEWAATYAEAR